MSTPIPMYVISNGDLAREVFNAVVTLLNADLFKTAVEISVLFSIIGAAISYIRGQNIAIFAKWFITYFALTAIMLTPKVTLEIIDNSDYGAVYTVANVPYGLGYPASLITSTAQGLVVAFEDAFHMVDDFAYNKTGMLFGSRVFRLSTEFNVIDPEVKSELNEYVKNCVFGDILINKKYSMTELTESKDILKTITSEPSNIRGIYIGGKEKKEFKTCRFAAIEIKSHLKKDVEKNVFKKFCRRIWGKYSPELEKTLLQGSLEKSYKYFSYGALSNSALEIATQNLLINGIRDGILNYTAETGATAALLNLSTTQAMERMRLSLATSRNIATYTIPVMHTVLLLLMLGLFPVVVLLAFQPNLTGQILKNYVYTLIWIESWPLMFACLNLVVTFYTKSTTGSIGAAGLTLSNIDQLALEHSDVANMAGYLMLAIPFISGGLVKGMSSAFNTAASYIGGVLQSSASSASSEVASGNLHLGNSSWNNVSANKFDTNSTLMRDAETEQLKSGVLRTTTAGGDEVYDSTHAISKLPVNVRSDSMTSASLSQQAEEARTATIQDQKTYDQSVSHAVTDLDSFGKSLGSSKSMGESFSTREAESAGLSASNMKNTAKTIAERNHVDVNDVFRGLVNFSQGASFNIGASVSGKIPLINIGEGKMGLDGKISTEHTRSQETSTQHGIGRSIDVTAEEAKRFSNDLHKVEEYSKTTHAETNNTEAASHLSQLSTDLRNARTASEQHSIHKSDSERLSSAASFVTQNSGQIGADFNQEFADHMVKTKGREKAEQLFAGKNQMELGGYAKEFISQSGIKNNIMATYQQGSSGIDPDKKYHDGQVSLDAKASGIGTSHEQEKQKIMFDAKGQGAGVDQQKFNQIKDGVENQQKRIGSDLKSAEKSRNGEYNALNAEVAKDIKAGAKKSKSSAFNVWSSIKPEFAKDKKGK